MAVREIRVSPDGQRVAIRGNVEDPEEWNAWGFFDAVHGGGWVETSRVSDWTVIQEGE